MRMDFSQYRELDGVNISLLLELLTSPKQFQWRRSHPSQDTAARRIGRVGHTAVLEPMNMVLEYVVSPFAKFTTKKARAWKAEQEEAGLTVLTKADYQTACAIRDAVLSHPTAALYLAGGAPEHTWTWTWSDRKTGMSCKGRIDYLSRYDRDGGPGSIVDLKTTRHVTPAAFSRQSANLLYHVRMAWYRDGHYEATGEKLPVVIVAAQKEPPWDVACYRVPQENLEAGRRVYTELLDTLQECIETDCWPGVAPAGLLDLPLPPWAAGATEDLAFDDEGGGLSDLELED